MKSRIGFSMLVLMLVTSLLASYVEPTMAAEVSKTPQKVIRWRMQTFTPPGSFTYKKLLPRIVEEVKKKTGGRFELVILPPGAVCPAPAMFETVSRGGIEAVQYSGPFYSGILPVGDVEFGLPFAWEDGHECNKMLWDYGLIDKVFRPAYKTQNVYLQGVWGAGPFGLITKFPINKLEDLKGRRIRATGPGRDMLDALGAATVITPFSELYLTLERGITEGTYTVYDSLVEMKLKEVTKYSIFPPWLNGDTMNILFNLEEWNKLPPDIQKGSEQALKDLLPWLWEVSLEEASHAIDVAKKESGHTVITLPSGEVAKLKKLALEQWKKLAGKDPYCKQAVDMIIEWNKQKGRL